jgi:rubrerythrin
MGRTLGSKNKPKVIKLSESEVNLANSLGVSTEEYAKEKLAMQKEVRRTARAKKKVDWEKLAKNLQQALAKEIQENQKLEYESNLIKEESDQIVKAFNESKIINAYLENTLWKLFSLKA